MTCQSIHAPDGALQYPFNITAPSHPTLNPNPNQGRRRALSQAAAASAAGGDSSPGSSSKHDPFNPTEEHRQLRDVVRAFTEKEVDPQALAFNRREEVGGWVSSCGVSVRGVLGGVGGCRPCFGLPARPPA